MINIDSNLIASVVVGVFVGAASAYLGSLMILKRMALVGDALSHVALPGIGIALTYGINPFLGAFTALAVGVLLVWRLSDKTDLPTEAIVGIIFTVSLAIGILITPEPELLEALFGDIAKVNFLD
ncbi:MAG: metal ABC transporter permease, partial [bacterium]|nr:metal ABC transporter permease [bacterium]